MSTKAKAKTTIIKKGGDPKGKTLVIVESGGKIKKIQSILGSEYVVMASVGHIIDLDSKKMSVDIENNFEPQYINNPDKDKVIKELKAAAKKASDILLASDEDREGEMIAWSLASVLNIKDPKRIVFNSITKDELIKAIKNPRKIDNNMVDAQKSRRILDRIMGYELSPILWKSIGASLSAGRVQSVVVRLILDRENEINNFFQNDLTSYFKSDATFLDKKGNSFQTFLFSTNKSDDDDIDDDDKKDNTNNKKGKKDIDAEEVNDDDEKQEEIDKEANGDIKKLYRAKITTESKMGEIIRAIMKSTFKLTGVKTKESLRYPSPPFTTSTLQQEAARKLGYTVKRTMNAAQKLYEAGFITYMRTDSINLSDEALASIGKFVVSEYGKEYHRKMNYKAKNKNTQEAHEAVRPTDVNVKGVSEEGKIGNDEIKLYNLIWKRAVASQMSPAKFNVNIAQINISQMKDYYFVSQTEEVLFSGFLAVYNITNTEKDDDNDGDANSGNIALPKVGSNLEIVNTKASQEYLKPPSRFNEASLINKLDPKNLNIGRPATYATIITKIQERNYVVKKDVEGISKESIQLFWEAGNKKINKSEKMVSIGKENNKLVPTELGRLVTDFLVKYFPKIMDYKFTAGMETQLDDIAEGKLIWHKMLDKFYKDFHKIVVDVSAKKTEIIDDNARIIGKDPDTGNDIIATIKKFGAVVYINDPSKKKQAYAPIKEPLTIDNITVDDAKKLLSFPITLGKYKNKSVILTKGKFGLYLKFGEDNISLKDSDITEENALETELDDVIKYIDDILKKRESYKIWEEKEDKTIYTVLPGKVVSEDKVYTPYIKVDNKSSKLNKPFNVKIPAEFINKDNSVKKEILNLEKVKEIVSLGKTNRYKKKTKDDTQKKSKDIDEQQGGKVKKSTTKKPVAKKKP